MEIPTRPTKTEGRISQETRKRLALVSREAAGLYYIKVTPRSGEAQEASQEPQGPLGGGMWFTLEAKRGHSGYLTNFAPSN